MTSFIFIEVKHFLKAETKFASVHAEIAQAQTKMQKVFFSQLLFLTVSCKFRHVLAWYENVFFLLGFIS